MLWNYRGVARRGGAAAASSWSVVLLCYGAGMLKFRRREVTSASHSKMSLVILEGGRKTHTHTRTYALAAVGTDRFIPKAAVASVPSYRGERVINIYLITILIRLHTGMLRFLKESQIPSLDNKSESAHRFDCC